LTTSLLSDRLHKAYLWTCVMLVSLYSQQPCT